MVIDMTDTDDDETAEDYAGDEHLWDEYIDPDATTPFNSITFAERVKLAQEVMDGNK